MLLVIRAFVMAPNGAAARSDTCLLDVSIQYSDCIYNPDPKQKGCERPARRRRFLQRFVSLDNGCVTMQRRFVGELPITSQN